MTISGIGRPGEFDIIARYFRPLAASEGAFALLDDAASLALPADQDLVMTLDTIAAGVHFFSEDPPASVARKALGVNLSDLAAKGATPRGYLVSLALPADWTENWIAEFAVGLAEMQTRFGWSVYGGDTLKSNGGLQISITAFGAVPKGRMVPRGGAKDGDVLYVSGTVGDSALGLQLRLDETRANQWGLSPQQNDYLIDRYLHPAPRTALTPALRTYASAAMDISDGLVGDLHKMCLASNLSSTVFSESIGISEAVAQIIKTDPAAFQMVLSGGDDYELLVAVSDENTTGFELAARASGVTVCRIGTFEKEAGPPRVLDVNGEAIKLAAASYVHF